MVVHPGSEEAQLGVRVGVSLRERGQVVEALGLREAVGKVERSLAPKLGRDVGEELVDRLDADRIEHRLAVGICCGRVAGHGVAPAGWWDRPQMLVGGPGSRQAQSLSSLRYASASSSPSTSEGSDSLTLTSHPSP